MFVAGGTAEASANWGVSASSDRSPGGGAADVCSDLATCLPLGRDITGSVIYQVVIALSRAHMNREEFVGSMDLLRVYCASTGAANPTGAETDGFGLVSGSKAAGMSLGYCASPATGREAVNAGRVGTEKSNARGRD